MRVERLTAYQVALPLRSPFRSAGSALAERRVVVVRLDAAGLSGWGEAAPVPGYSQESLDDVWSALEEATELLGRPVADALGPQPKLPPAARAALDGALADVRARRDGVPLWRALGGAEPVVTAGAVAGLHPDPSAVRAEVAAFAAAGYRAVKIKIAPGADRDRLDAVRRDHPDLTLGADANGSYGLGDLESMAGLDAFRLAYLEQPLAAHDLAGHARLAATMSTPICLDESITGTEAVGAVASSGAASVVNLKPGRLGGLDRAVAALDAAGAAGLHARVGGMLETGIGRSHLVALATLPGFSFPADLSASARYFDRDLVDPPWELVDGTITAPAEPGLGVTVDVEAVIAHAERVTVHG